MAENLPSATVAESTTGQIFGSFVLSSRARFAIKTALAITISYLVCLAMNWGQPYQGAVAIMVIASVGPLQDSVGKGVLRILGTIAGAIVGLGLVALFPQDRFAYFLSVSIAIAVVVYLYRTYRLDNSLWMILLVVVIFLFDGGSLNNRFIYSIERVWSTAFGIFVYAMVNIYLWPERKSISRVERLHTLGEYWQELLHSSARWDGEVPEKIRELEGAFRESLRLGKTEYPGGVAFDTRRWRTLLPSVRSVDRSLGKLALLQCPGRIGTWQEALPPLRKMLEAVRKMSGQHAAFWRNPQTMTLPELQVSEREIEEAFASWEADQEEKAEAITCAWELHRLYLALHELLERLNAVLSPRPDLAELTAPMGRIFRTPDADDFKSILVTLLIYWTALAVWIYGNPDQGYTMVGLAVIVSLIIINTPINPLVLFIAFTLSFLVSILAYVFVLPHLHNGWELGLYIFVYMFLIYFFVPEPLSIVMAQGLIFQYIVNDIVIDFRLYVMLIIDFSLFLGILLLFYYLPFSTRPEHVLQNLRRRFERFCRTLHRGKLSWRKVELLTMTVEKMRLWAGQLDRKYFDGIDGEKLQAYLQQAEALSVVAALLGEVEQELRRKGLYQRVHRILATEGSRGLSRLKERENAMESIALLSEYALLKQRIGQGVRKLEDLSRHVGWDDLKKGKF